MGQPFNTRAVKLSVMALVSTLWLLAGMFGGARISLAHEVVPVIADFSVNRGQATLSMRMNLEAFAADIDLDAVIDTNDTEEAARYDAFRALSPELFEVELRRWAPDWIASVGLLVDGERVPLEWQSVDIPEVGDVELLRPSILVLNGDIGGVADQVQIAWPQGSGGLVIRQQGVREPYTGYIEGGMVSDPFPIHGGAGQSGWDVLLAYVPVGFEHILPKGLDHILFVLGLFFLSSRIGPLLWQVSAFTLAHTVTLALGALGIVAVPASIVEPLIAASITYVAVENIFTKSLNRWRPWIVFGFGLLHGLGFASVLGAFGLPEGQFIPALIGFNIGVELGQLAVIAVAFALVGLWFRNRWFYRAYIAVPASFGIACIGAFWFVERVFL